jgi:WD40 repeat protein
VRYVLSVALSKTGTRIASGGADKRVRIWSVADGKALQAFEGHEKDVESVQFLRGDELLLSISEDRTMRLWDVGRGQQVLTAVFYSDGEYLAYTGKGLFTGTAGAARRLEVASDGQWQPLSDAEIERLYRTAGLEPAER